MKIGIATDASTSFYSKSYPHLRDEVAWFKLLCKDYDVVQVCPTASANVIKNYNSNRGVLSEPHLVGVRPTENEDEDIDILFVSTFPWITRFNYHGFDLIKKYAKKVNTIIWRVTDPEDYEDKRESILYDMVPKHPEVYEKVKLVMTTDPLYGKHKPRIKELYPNYLVVPFPYDPEYEIPIKSERRLLAKFVGPIGSHRNIIEILPYLDELGKKLGMDSEFWGEGYAGKTRNPEYDLFQHPEFKTLKPKFERVFKPYNEYIEFMSDAYITFYDGMTKIWDKEVQVPHWYTSKILDTLYAGTLPMITPFIGYEGLGLCPLLDAAYLHSIEEFIKYPSSYVTRVQEVRNSMNENYGVHKWYPIIKQGIENACN